MSELVTQVQAAEILGCHVSNIGKLVAKGQLTPTRAANRTLPSLDRAQVEALAEQRAQGREAQAVGSPRKYQRVDHRPDTEHEWLSVRQVAELLGITKKAVLGRIHRERLPAIENGGRFWVRRDLLEQVEAARLVRKTRRP